MPVIGLNIRDVLCIQDERTVQNDNSVRYGGHVLQIPQTRHRHYVRAKVQVNTYPDGTMALFYGPLCIAEYEQDGQLKHERSKETEKAA